MYSFYGPAHFVSVGLGYVWRRLTGKTVTAVTRRFGVPLFETRSINAPSYIEKVKQLSPDVIVSVAAPQLFKKEIIAAARLGCINSHSALLPQNKGMMPVFWAMLKGAKTLGVTIHYINERFDDGDIIMQESVPIGNESLHELILKTKRISAHLIDTTLRRIADGAVTSAPMPPGGSYQSFPKPHDVREFRRRGKKIM
jgi:methionyl-tRNA formyltransferase